jgi:predicted nucleic acid-binding protein
MKQTVYIESSVVSYFTARPSKNVVMAGHQATTRDFWDRLPKYEIYISELVLLEVGRGDESAAAARLEAINGFRELEIDEACKALAKALVADRAVPEQYPEDALHIAVASVHSIDTIVTWNFKHMNNPATRSLVRKSVEAQGYCCPELCSPDELLGEDDE